MKKKDILNHELMNLLTMIRFTAEQYIDNKDDKKNFNHWIKLVSLFVRFEGLFTENKFLTQRGPVSLAELFELLKIINKTSIDNKQLKIKNISEDAVINADKLYIQEALNLLISSISTDYPKTEVFADIGKKSITIKYDGEKIQKKAPVSCLSRDNLMNHVIHTQVGLELLERMGLKLKYKMGELIIKFNIFIS